MHRFKLTELLDKLLLLLAMLVFAWVGLRAIVEVRELDNMAGQGRVLLSEQKVNAPTYEAEVPESKDLNWISAKSQSRGEDWVFDVFTPPVIYYDPNSREFAVTPPSLQVVESGDTLWAAFDVELIEVRQRPYKLQLVGYAGSEGSYIAYFENSNSGGLVYLSLGQEESDLGVRLISFAEQKIEVASEGGTPVVETVGVARIADYASGQEISLTNLETKMYSDLEARIRLLPGGAVRSVQIGSRLALETGDYLIEDLSVQPPEATITKISKDGGRRYSRTLSPATDKEAQPRGSRLESEPHSPFAIRPRSQSKKPRG